MKLRTVPRLLSPNHPIRQHVRWNYQADLLGGFEVDHKLELCWLLNRHFTWICTFQDLVHVRSSASVLMGISRRRKTLGGSRHLMSNTQLP
jgi:hypothetical protein